jgi:acyl dehydratase
MRIFDGIGDLEDAPGTSLGRTEWLTIDQGRINTFAEVSGDDLWLHIDVERAADGPFGKTIGHGYLTLSLLPYFLRQLYRIDGVRLTLNYGLNKVRFPAPVLVDARLRAVAEVVAVSVLEGGVEMVVRTTIEMEGSEKPACVVESVTRSYE